MNERLAVFIYIEDKLKNTGIVDFITYGIEEEGIPYHIVSDGATNYKELAEKASNDSQLDVGIGVDASGNMCLHHAKLPDQYYLFDCKYLNDQKKLRDIGVNGARLVKGIPFIV